MRVGVVGAGLSGLLCAQRLVELVPALQISVLEWGRGPGGRTARRRVTPANAFANLLALLSLETPKWQEVCECGLWREPEGGEADDRICMHQVMLGDGAELSFDHAAPFFSATTAGFKDLLARWQVALCCSMRAPRCRECNFYCAAAEWQELEEQVALALCSG